MGKLRYRDHACGVTSHSLRAAKRNLAKLGEVSEIRGYRYTSTRSAGFTVPYTAQHECILVKGPKGTQRYEGLLYSYFGEGPRGLVQILKACGFNQQAAEAIAFYTPRGTKNGTDFVIKFPIPVPVDPNKITV